MADQMKPRIVILRRKEVEARTGLSRSTIYKKMRQDHKHPGYYDPTFPLPVSLGANAIGWVESEIDAWLEAQIAKSRKAA
ncbi:AlpA family transcriptional regulator [Azospira sp. I13]|uniref:helix-turn-helix transcriptional regulator n=1 Tax=Azospira sp. I13 TaxID=1765050 RepID=UPI000D5994E5|nr:AlpA family transcriptional regulator [Azospira sp. I13]